MLYSVHSLRFLASFVVVISHSFNVLDIDKTISVGDAGVDVFFVISGIVIGLSTKDGASPLSFFVRRFIRIMPLYWIALLAFVGFRYSEWQVTPTADDFIRSFFLIPKFGTGWFPLVFQAWTLSFEFMFYIFFGTILAIAKKNVSFICSITLISLAVAKIPVPFGQGAYFDTQLCAEFVFGLGLAQHVNSKPTRYAWLGIACCAIAVFTLFNNRYGDVDRVIQWGIPSAILVFGVMQFEGWSFLRNRYFEILGSSSYAIYLFHITSMVWLRERAATLFGVDLRQHPAISLAVLVAWAIASGTAVHLIIERPMLGALRRAIPREKHSKLSQSV
jgi:exopolysaccharide production protein ExoZ